MVKRFFENLAPIAGMAIQGHINSPLFNCTPDSHNQLNSLPHFIEILKFFEEITVK
jgi:hypothetical protein